eukprot:GILI01001277.1.p1 GENE.GILI01001277.1~~GILI01001277.1.p1  ORF type:complete len:552 (+),score=107.77 GILI01001277.1:633-2288(+)
MCKLFPTNYEEFQMFAYMDDITLVGPPQMCTAAFQLLEPELQRLNLEVNPKKTVTTSDVISQQFPAFKLDTCPRLLGGYVGTIEAEIAKLIGLVPKHDNLFRRLRSIYPPVAFALLTTCAAPRWGHLIRSHEPEVSFASTSTFTQNMLECAGAILGVDHHEFSEEALFQLTLPIRLGGCGLTNWTNIREIAYQCSLAAVRQQDVHTRAHHESRVKSLAIDNKDFHQHLDRCKHQMSTRWLTAPLSYSSLQPTSFALALLLRLRWQKKSAACGTVACRCRFPQVDVTTTMPRDVLVHQLGCVMNGGVTDRHHSIVRYLAGLLRQCYFMVDIEATLSPTLRMDIVAEDKDSRLYIDVTVANSTSKTHEKKSFETLVKEKTAEKEKKYSKIAADRDFTLHTFFMDTFGRMDAKSLSLVKMLHTRTANDPTICREKPLTLAQTLAPLSEAVAYGNAQCLRKCGLLESMGISFRNALWRKRHNPFGEPNPGSIPVPSEGGCELDDEQDDVYGHPADGDDNINSCNCNCNSSEEVEGDGVGEKEQEEETDDGVGGID